MQFWRDIGCLSCAYTITLPSPSQKRTDPNRGRLKHPEHLAIVCPRCNNGHAHRLSDFRPYPREWLNPYRDGGELKIFEVRFECVGKNCKFPVALVAIADASTTAHSITAATANWKLHGVKCHAGHDPKIPLSELY